MPNQIPGKGNYNFIDLFAGAGGLSEGFIQAGFNPIAHVEMNAFAAQTLITRSAYYYLKQTDQLDIYYHYLRGDIAREDFLKIIPNRIVKTVICETMSDDTLPGIFKTIDGIMKIRNIQSVDVVVGGPPCQAYSLVGRAQSSHMSRPMSEDPRNSTIEQDVLKQSIELGLVEPRFEAIAGALRAWIKPRWVYLRKDHSEFQLLKDSYSEEEWTKNTSEDETGVYLDILTLRQLKKDLPAAVVMLLDTLSLNSFELFQNGLGYNNILFMSTVLGDMKTSADTALFNLLLVEEPEAHLHPQLQELVHGFFDKNSNRESFQVIYTSHSPTLVSRIGIDKLVLLYEQKHRVNCLSLSQSNIDEDDRDNLERYLDVTKSQMLFAKGILFVEGISEALLLPIFAEYLNRPLDKYAVEVINVDGVSFKPFANLLCYANDTHQVTIKATIITDDDRCTNKEDKETYIVKDIDYDTDDIDSIVLKLKSTTPSERFQACYGFKNTNS